MYNKKQRTAALIAVILILLLILALLIASALDQGGKLFQALLFAVIALPILAWIYIWLFGRFTGKKTIADFDRGQKDLPESGSDAENEVTLSKNPFLNKNE